MLQVRFSGFSAKLCVPPTPPSLAPPPAQPFYCHSVVGSVVVSIGERIKYLRGSVPLPSPPPWTSFIVLVLSFSHAKKLHKGGIILSGQFVKPFLRSLAPTVFYEIKHAAY